MIRIALASESDEKERATRSAFQRAIHPSTHVDVIKFDAASGISHQPRSKEETMTGAFNRLHHLQKQLDTWPLNNEYPFDYIVSIEGGVDPRHVNGHDYLYMVGAVIVQRLTPLSDPVLTWTMEYPLPSSICDLLSTGPMMGVGSANDQIYQCKNSKSNGGAEALYTNGRITRAALYEQAILFSLSMRPPEQMP